MKTPRLRFVIYWLALTGLCHADDAFHVSVQPPEGQTGNMHYSAVMGLQLGDARPVFLKSDIVRGVLAPSEVLLTKRVGKDAMAVFAYSSMGGGSETLQVILLSSAHHSTVVTDQLQMKVRRGTGGFLWADGGGLFVVQPAENLENDEVFLASKHAASPYGEIGKLNFTDPPQSAVLISGLSRYFAPPVSQSLKVVRIPFSNGRFDLPGAAGKKR